MTQDIINFCFGFFGSILAYQNILEAKKHQTIKGMHYFSTAFFSAWGLWNVYFYSHLNLPLSALGSVCIVVVDIYWLFLYYEFNKKP